jgi:hypothetical protein
MLIEKRMDFEKISLFRSSPNVNKTKFGREKQIK